MIENDVVTLVEMGHEDQEFYQQIYTNDQIMEFVLPALTKDAAQRSFEIILKKMSFSPPVILFYVIYSHTLNTKVGVIGVRWNQVNSSHVEIGVMVLVEFQRQGFAQQAKSLLIDYCFHELNIECIVAICDKENLAANIANKKLGFTCVSEIKKQNKTQIEWKINQ